MLVIFPDYGQIQNKFGRQNMWCSRPYRITICYFLNIIFVCNEGWTFIMQNRWNNISEIFSFWACNYMLLIWGRFSWKWSSNFLHYAMPHDKLGLCARFHWTILKPKGKTHVDELILNLTLVHSNTFGAWHIQTQFHPYIKNPVNSPCFVFMSFVIVNIFCWSVC